ncbi:MAG TPA: YCF48-related protein, partial [Bacteroidota bacterium]
AGDAMRRSTSGGASWSMVSSGYPLRDVCIVPGTQEVWAVGDGATSLSSILFHSTDGSANWETRFLSGFESFSAVKFINSQRGYLGSSSLGRVYRTTDGGASWTNASTSPPMVRVFDFAFGSPDSGHAVGSGGLNGKISFTTNSGTNWSTQAQTGIPSLRAVDFYPSDPNIRAAVGDSGFILQTTNLGQTWIPRISGTTRDLEGVAYASASDIYAVGDLGTIIRSTDGGGMWSEQSSGTTSTLSDVAFISSDTGFAVGNNGLILATTTGGVVAVSEDSRRAGIPKQTVLEQNYPNPFNPTTRIKYQIPNSNHVTLKVFDILGREVGTLVNETRIAGEHEVTFDANGLARQTAGGLASGVYFYRLQTSNFVDTKKLLLLR